MVAMIDYQNFIRFVQELSPEQMEALRVLLDAGSSQARSAVREGGVVGDDASWVDGELYESLPEVVGDADISIDMVRDSLSGIVGSMADAVSDERGVR